MWSFFTALIEKSFIPRQYAILLCETTESPTLLSIAFLFKGIILVDLLQICFIIEWAYVNQAETYPRLSIIPRSGIWRFTFNSWELDSMQERLVDWVVKGRPFVYRGRAPSGVEINQKEEVVWAARGLVEHERGEPAEGEGATERKT